MAKVINLYGGPGTGKSTTAAALFAIMKQHGHNVEMAREYAKSLVWHDRKTEMTDQLYIFAKQNHKIHMLNNQVDFIITDAPILKSIIYGEKCSHAFKQLVHETYNKYDNIDIFLTRLKAYNPSGRTQSEAQAIALDTKFHHLVAEHCPTYYVFDTNCTAPEMIYHLVMEPYDEPV